MTPVPYTISSGYPYRVHLTRLWPLIDYFFVSDKYTPVPNVSVALDFQDRLVAFINGKHHGWPNYGRQGKMFNITADGFESQDFPARLKERCDTINGVLLDPENGI